MAVDKGDLVARAEAVVKELKESLGERREAGKIQETGKTQASKAIEVVRSAGSIRVFRNWLRYQMEREEFWKVPALDKPLAQRIDEETRVIEDSSGEQDTAVKDVILFLGYFYRSLTAINHLDKIPPALQTGGHR